MRKVLEVSIVLWLASLLCSCASVSVIDTWRNPELRPQRLQKILVVSISNKDAARHVYEDMLASELSRKGVEAIPGYTVIPGAAFADWGVLDRAVRRAQAQAILTVQTTKVEKQTTVQPDSAYPGYWYPQGFPTWDFPGYYRSMALYGPTYVTTYDVATMQVNLFDAGTDKLIWAATMESTDPQKVTTVGQDLARKVVNKLAQEGLI